MEVAHEDVDGDECDEDVGADEGLGGKELVLPLVEEDDGHGENKHLKARYQQLRNSHHIFLVADVLDSKCKIWCHFTDTLVVKMWICIEILMWPWPVKSVRDTVWCQYNSVNFLLRYSPQTPHRLLVRACNGVPCVSSNPDLCDTMSSSLPCCMYDCVIWHGVIMANVQR